MARKPYHHFTAVEREILAHLVRMHATQKEMERCLNRSERSIRAELKRNAGCHGYVGCEAQRRAEHRRREARHKSQKLKRPELAAAVMVGLRKHWSPDQIAGRMKRDFPANPHQRCSSSTIYRWLKTDDHGAWRKRFLRNYKRRKRPIRSTKPPARVIAERPEIINSRARIGDWEGDTVVGRGGRASLGTFVERRTGYLLLLAVENRLAATLRTAMERRLRTLPAAARQSLTLDNGSEFAEAAKLKASLGIDIYFAAPRCPWQRGSNEHTNRLLREFFPKGTDLRHINRRKLSEIQQLLNQRPRKRLNYQTPAEVFTEFCQRIQENCIVDFAEPIALGLRIDCVQGGLFLFQGAWGWILFLCWWR